MTGQAKWAVIAIAVTLTACGPIPALVDYPIRSGDPHKAPIVIVGTIIDDKAVAPPKHSHWEFGSYNESPHSPVIQMHILHVKVENVLRGKVDLLSAAIYYFAFTESWDGHQALGRWGANDRELIYVQRDHDVFRLACDGLNYCVDQVATGSHMLRKGDSQQSFDTAIAEILLTRGKSCDDKVFSEMLPRSARAVEPAYALPKLRILAGDSNPSIRRSACVALWEVAQLPCAEERK